MTSESENAPPAPPPAPAKPEKPKESWWSFIKFLAILFVATLFVRSCVVAPFSIPSASMYPTLLIGDYLFVSKWSYGYSQHSFPFGIIRYDGRVMGSSPERGDVVVFRHPRTGDDWVKRVIGLPGDEIEIRGGQIILNGQPVPRERIADFVLPVSDNMIAAARNNGGGSPCNLEPGSEARQATDDDGQPVCIYPRYRETLPDGRNYEVLDQGNDPATRRIDDVQPWGRDNVQPFRVPDGVVFVMGDNRDDSLDGRFPAVLRNSNGAELPIGGVGMLPIDNIQGRALVSFFSTDGSAQWLLPWTWFTAARWSRFGMTYP